MFFTGITHIYTWLCILLLILEILSRDPASRQLEEYKKNNPNPGTIQTDFGRPVDDVTSMLTVGPRGYMLTQDITGFDILARFTRERTPERTHFTKGAGAFGYFEVTNDITKYTKAVLFSKVGKRTKIGVRFSIMISLPGTPDMVRGLRGSAIKFYTEEGTWDLLGYHITSIFSDSVVSHTYLGRRNPVTDVTDENIFWDLRLHHPNSLAQTIRLFGNEGTPEGYRHMNGHAINTFIMINKEETAVFVKFHWLTDQGTKYLTPAEASELVQAARDYSIRDLYNAIALKTSPSWTLYIQVMDIKNAERYKYNPFDSYREWPRKEFPYIEVGKLILTENPKNYFAEVEQIAFSPAHMVPGIEPSPDRLLQGRLLLYTLAHQHRLGTNYLQISVNKPFQHGVTNYHRDGMAVMDNQGDCPNYYPNSFNGPEGDQSATFSVFHVSGEVSRYNNTNDYSDLAQNIWSSMSKDNKINVLKEMSKSLRNATSYLQDEVTKMVIQAVPELGYGLRKALFGTLKIHTE